MSTLCERLHRIVRKGKTFKYPVNYKDLPQNGIYVFFEKDELGHSGNRIVRIGINKNDGNFINRIKEHYEG